MLSPALCGCGAPALLFPALVSGGKGCEWPQVLLVCGGTFPAGNGEGRRVLLGPCALGGGWSQGQGCLLAHG